MLKSMPGKMEIRKAVPEDSDALTAISFRSKRVWPYPEANFEKWSDELTITSAYIVTNTVFLAYNKSSVAGYYSIVNPSPKVSVQQTECNLDHLFISPEFIGQKIGTQLFRHARETANALG